MVLCAVMVIAGRAEAFYQKSTITSVADTHLSLTDQTTLSGCDNCTRWVPLPFPFIYYGVSYTQVLVSTDGWAAFVDPGGNRNSNVKFEWNGAPGTSVPLIAPFWDDLDPARGGDVRYGQVGSHFTISWSVQHHTGGTRQIWFQLKLFQDNTFEIHYLVTVFGDAAYDHGKSATAGYQAGDSLLVATNLSHNQANLTAGTAWRFRPYNRPIYVMALDIGGRPRGSIQYRLPTDCTFYETSITTSANGWVVKEQPSSTGPNCSLPLFVWGTPELTTNDPLIGKQKLAPTLRHNGATALPLFVWSFVDAGFTWPQDLVQTPTPGGTLQWWDSVPEHFFPLLILPGLDPMNEESPADVLASMGALAWTFHQDGYEIGIGKPSTGNKAMENFRADTAAWVDMTRARSTATKVQLIGISMGGVLLRDYLWQQGSAANSKVGAVYFVDSPLTGANMGSPVKGVQTLVDCYRRTTPDYTKLNSPPSKQLKFDHANEGQCACTAAEHAKDSWCPATQTPHNTFYDGMNWYTGATYKRYAFSFGDGTGTLSYRPGGKLYDFFHSSGWCPGFASGQWYGTQRDCAPGSEFLIPSMVDTSERSGWSDIFGINVCATGSVGLAWNPSFITLDSALGFNITQWSSAENQTCTPPSFTAPSWGSRAAATTTPWSAPANYFTERYPGTANTDHHFMPAGHASTLRTLINSNALN